MNFEQFKNYYAIEIKRYNLNEDDVKTAFGVYEKEPREFLFGL